MPSDAGVSYFDLDSVSNIMLLVNRRLALWLLPNGTSLPPQRSISVPSDVLLASLGPVKSLKSKADHEKNMI